MDDRASATSSLIKAAFEQRGERIDVACEILRTRRPEIKLPYLMGCPDVLESDLNLERLAEISRTIIEVCLGDGLLEGLSGLEILARVVRNGIAVRILRLSVFNDGLNTARNIAGADLLRPAPFPGVYCRMYMTNLPKD
jgi:hypothetical protein